MNCGLIGALLFRCDKKISFLRIFMIEINTVLAIFVLKSSMKVHCIQWILNNKLAFPCLYRYEKLFIRFVDLLVTQNQFTPASKQRSGHFQFKHF